MLYILNKSSEAAIKELALLGSEDDSKHVLLITDAVFLATDKGLERFKGLDVDTFYAAKDAVEARVFTPSSSVEVVDYAEMAELIEDADKVVVL